MVELFLSSRRGRLPGSRSTDRFGCRFVESTKTHSAVTNLDTFPRFSSGRTMTGRGLSSSGSLGIRAECTIGATL